MKMYDPNLNPKKTGNLVDISVVTHLKQQIKQLEQNAKAIAYARDLAHEMNQPLTGITGLASLIMEELDENSEHYENIKELEYQARRLRDLIQKFQNIL